MPKDHPRNEAVRTAQLSKSTEEAQRKQSLIDRSPKSKGGHSYLRRLKGVLVTEAHQK
jgi:hypothetical protein